MINSKITNTKKVFKDFAKYSVKTNVTMKIIYTLAVLILAASVVLFVSNHILDGAIFAVLGVIFALCAPAMQWLNITNNKNNVGSTDEFEFYEDRFVVTSFDKNGLEISDSTLIYSRLYKVKKHLNYGYIYVNKAVAYIVDKNEFENEEQFNEVLDRISKSIINNKKNRGTTPVVFGSQNVTAPTEEPPQDLGEPVPPPPTEEDLAYEEEQKENKRITEFDGEQKIDYEGNVTVVAVEETAENETEVYEDKTENAEDNIESEVETDEATDVTLKDENDDEGDDASEQEPFDVEKEYPLFPTEQDEEVKAEEVEEDNQPMSDEAVPFAEVDDVDDGDETPAEQTPTEQVEELNTETVEEVVPAVDEEQPEEFVQPVQEPVVEEAEETAYTTPAEQEVQPVDNYADFVEQEEAEEVETAEQTETPVVVEETPVVDAPVVEEKKEEIEENETSADVEAQPKRKRGRPAGTTKKPKTEEGEDKPKRKRGRPVGTTKKKPAEKKTSGKRGRPAKPKTEQADKPKGKRGRPAKPKTEEELNKPKGKRGRPRKNKVEEVSEVKPAQDVAVAEEKPTTETSTVVVTPVVAEQPEEIVQPVQKPVVEEVTEEPEVDSVIATPAEEVEETQPYVEATVQSEPIEQPAESKPVEENFNAIPTEAEVVSAVEVNNFASDDDTDNTDNTDDVPAEQQPVEEQENNFVQQEIVDEEETTEEDANFEMPSDINQVVQQQPTKEDLDEVAALQAEYNMEEPVAQTEVQPEVENQLNVETTVQSEPIEQPVQPEIVEENSTEEEEFDIEGPADLGTPASTTYQPPIIEDTEVDNANYNAENETFTISTGDEGAVEPQDFDNNSYISDVDNDDNNDEGNLGDIGDINVNINDVSAVVDNMPEDVEGESVEDESVNEFPTDIDDDTTKNI